MSTLVLELRQGDMMIVNGAPIRFRNRARIELTAKARNRVGDCLMLIGKPGEALPAYEEAVSLAPDDAYPLYNRGRAKLALGDATGAKADFEAAAGPRFKQPKARQLAREALGKVP